MLKSRKQENKKFLDFAAHSDRDLGLKRVNGLSFFKQTLTEAAVQCYLGPHVDVEAGDLQSADSLIRISALV